MQGDYFSLSFSERLAFPGETPQDRKKKHLNAHPANLISSPFLPVVLFFVYGHYKINDYYKLKNSCV